MLNRPQFIVSIVHQYISMEQAQSVKDTFEGYVSYLVKNKMDKDKINLPENNQQFKKLMDANSLALHQFMQETCTIYGFPPKRAV